jgi:hypothetical protein
VISLSQGRYTRDNKNTEYTHILTSMPLVGFEITISALEQAKTVHALDHAATEIRGKVMTSVKEEIKGQCCLCIIRNKTLKEWR